MPPDNQYPSKAHNNTLAYYIIAAAAILIGAWFLYSGPFFVIKPIETLKTPEELKREALIQSLVSPPSINPTTKEVIQVSKSLSSPKKQTITSEERERLINSLNQ